MDRRVVITGLGAVTPVGERVDEIFTNLMNGHSGVRETTRFDTSRCPVKTSGEVVGFNPEDHGISPRDQRVLDRYQQYALAASNAALLDAGLDLPRNEIVSRKKSDQRFQRYGAAIGMAFSSTEVLQDQFAKMAEKGTRGVSPRLFNMTLPNAGTSLLSVRYGLCGPLVTVSGASASGSDSVIAAYDKIRHGRAEVMLAGGAESPSPRSSSPASRRTTPGPPPARAGPSTATATARCSARVRPCSSWRSASTPSPARPVSTENSSATACAATPST
ncbi:beta-ketoacyl synthase N-terminal-like domain-containing protein [Streptomyces diastatochromogenes]|nr:beta-ketoacyl synthase N-terminal-like domain-containing protein [Streptomyces diastatochromogenes]